MAVTIRDRLTGEIKTIDEYNSAKAGVVNINDPVTTFAPTPTFGIAPQNTKVRTIGNPIDTFAPPPIQAPINPTEWGRMAVDAANSNVQSAITGINTAANRNVFDISKTFSTNRPVSDAEKLNSDSLKMLQEGATEGFAVDRTLASRALQESDLQGAANIQAQSMRSAMNPNLTEGAKQAQMSETTRQQGIARSKLSGDLTIAAQERAFTALQQLTTASLQRASFDEAKYQADLTNAFADIKIGLDAAIAKGNISVQDAANQISLFNTAITDENADNDRALQALRNDADVEYQRALIAKQNREIYTANIVNARTRVMEILDSDPNKTMDDVKNDAQVKAWLKSALIADGYTADQLDTDQELVDLVGTYFEGTESTVKSNIKKIKADKAKLAGYETWEAYEAANPEEATALLQAANQAVLMADAGFDIKKVTDPENPDVETYNMVGPDGEIMSTITVSVEKDDKGNVVIGTDGKPVTAVEIKDPPAAVIPGSPQVTLPDGVTIEKDTSGVSTMTIVKDGVKQVIPQFDPVTILPFNVDSPASQAWKDNINGIISTSQVGTEADGKTISFQGLSDLATSQGIDLSPEKVSSIVSAGKTTSEKMSLINDYIVDSVMKKSPNLFVKKTNDKGVSVLEYNTEVKAFAEKQAESYVNNAAKNIADGTLPLTSIDFKSNDPITRQLYDKLVKDSTEVKNAVAKENGKTGTDSAKELYIDGKSPSSGQLFVSNGTIYQVKNVYKLNYKAADNVTVYEFYDPLKKTNSYLAVYPKSNKFNKINANDETPIFSIDDKKTQCRWYTTLGRATNF
jgi:hypothetical protein